MPRHTNSKNTPIKTSVKPIVSSSPVVIRNNSTLFGSIKEGFGFGIGSTIARNLFSTTPTYRQPSNNLDIRQPSCMEYIKCLESDDKYECFRNLDQKEYLECKTKD